MAEMEEKGGNWSLAFTMYLQRSHQSVGQGLESDVLAELSYPPSCLALLSIHQL